MKNWLIDLKISYYLFIKEITDIFMTKTVSLFPSKLIYWIVDNTTSLCYHTIPAMSLLEEIRKRGIFEYYCFIHIICYSTTGRYSSTEVTKLSVGEAMLRFKKDKIK